ncbi:MAG TPA: hypothetical protein VIK11_13220, partial [Tepidiformaceae bacterium]
MTGLSGGIDFAIVFGSWPNVMQRLASALIAGMVAAVTAPLVVRLSRRNEAQRADELAARQAARTLLEDGAGNFSAVASRRRGVLASVQSGLARLPTQLADHPRPLGVGSLTTRARDG